MIIKFEPLRKRGLYFRHINVNSLLSKIDDLRDRLVGHTKPSVLGITELKLNCSVSDPEVNISGYSILWSDRNRYGGGVALIGEMFPQIQLKSYFSIYLFQVKASFGWYFIQNTKCKYFSRKFCKQFETYCFKKADVSFLGDFNIILLVNDKFVTKKNQSLDFKILNYPLMSKYKELCQTFSWKEIIQEPTHIISTNCLFLTIS